MKLGIATNQQAASEPQWVDFDMEGWESNLNDPEDKRVRFLIIPQTRALINRIDARADNLAKAKGRNKYADDPSLPSEARDRGDYFTREMAKELTKDWQNVTDLDENPLECNDHNKIWLFENINIAFWIITKAQEISSVRIEDEQKNSSS